MSLNELKNCIDSAIECCQCIIQEHPNAVLSEADFERLLSCCISRHINEDPFQKPNDDDFSVHTQISHYFEKDGHHKLDRRVDILLLKESQLQDWVSHKQFKYSGESVAFELKYLHESDPIAKVECDFCKWKDLKNDSSLFVVVLIDASNDNSFDEKCESIKAMYERHNEIADNSEIQLYYKVLKKNIIQ